MKPGEIVICRADEAAATAARLKPAAVLSIEHPEVREGERGRAPRLERPPQLILSFWDSEAPVASGPDRAQVEKGLAFVMEHITQGGVIIHCNAGIARSAGLALGVLALLNPHKDEKTLVEELLRLRPVAAPNILVVEMVDELTGRGGRLLQAVRDHAAISAARKQAEEKRHLWAKLNPEKIPRPPLP